MKNGFDKVSIKQIHEESGLAAGSIYYYFKDKDEILEQMVIKYLINPIQRLKDKILAFDGSIMERLELLFNHGNSPLNTEIESLDISIEFSFDYREYWILHTSIYHQHPEVRPLFSKLCEELHEFYNKLIQEAIEKKEIRKDIDIKTLNLFIRTVFRGFLILLVFQPNLSSEKLLKANTRLVWEAIKEDRIVQ